MLLFRSGEHVDRWLAGRAPGATLSSAQLQALATRWWGDRLSTAWSPRARDAGQAILQGLDLVGEFWELP